MLVVKRRKSNFAEFIVFAGAFTAFLGIVILDGGNVFGQDLNQREAVEIADDAKLLEGLRQRQLFEMADGYCADLIAKNKLGPRRQTNLTVERLKTLTAMAVFASKAERAEIWKRIEQLADEFHSSNKGTRRLLVKAQAALAQVAHVRLIRQELDAKLVGADAGKWALQQLRVSRTQIESLIRDVEKSIPTAPKESSDRDLATEQLLELVTNMKFQFAVCNLERCQLYDAKDLASRADALAQASQQIEDVTRSARPGSDLWWEANLASSKQFRLSGKPAEAEKLFKRLPQGGVPDHLLTSYLIEKLRVQQGSRDVASVERSVRELINSPGREARLDFALLNASIWLSENASAKSGNWKTFSTALLKSIKASHGGYWGRRAEIALLGALDRGAIQSSANTEAATDSDLTILIQLAESAQAENRFQVAADSFEKAIQLARQLKSNETVFQLAVRQSQCYEKLNQHLAAAESLFLAATNRRHNNAATAHLRGCWNLAQQLGKGSADAVQTNAERFQTELDRHLVDWPESNSADTARFWLADHFRQRRRYQDSLDRLLSVSQDSPKFNQAIVAAAEAITGLLNQMQSNNQSVDTMTDRLLARLKEAARGDSSATDIAELLSADIELRFRGRVIDAGRLEKISEIDWSSAERIDSLADVGQAMKVVSGFSRPSEFQKQIEIIDSQAVLQRLGEYLDAIWKSQKAAASAKANLSVSSRGRQIAEQQNDAKMIAFWELRTSDIQLMLGENEAAINSLKSLVKQFPRKADLQIKLAQAMTAVYRKSDPDKAINQWRRLVTKLRPQSDNWFLAKYQVASLLAESGDKVAAGKLLKFMQANPPGWEKSSLKREFDALLRQVDR